MEKRIFLNLHFKKQNKLNSLRISLTSSNRNYQLTLEKGIFSTKVFRLKVSSGTVYQDFWTSCPGVSWLFPLHILALSSGKWQDGYRNLCHHTETQRHSGDAILETFNFTYQFSFFIIGIEIQRELPKIEEGVSF